jgi:hypothetical protein
MFILFYLLKLGKWGGGGNAVTSSEQIGVGWGGAYLSPFSPRGAYSCYTDYNCKGRHKFFLCCLFFTYSDYSTRSLGERTRPQLYVFKNVLTRNNGGGCRIADFSSPRMGGLRSK